MSATPLYQLNSGLVSRHELPDILDKAMDVWVERQNRVLLQGMELVATRNSKTPSFKITDVGDELDLPQVYEDGNPAPFVNPPKGYDKTFTCVEYANAVRVTMRAQEVDLSGKIRMRIGGLLKSGQQKVEYLIADIFNSGASTAGADGSFLFANDHYYSDPQWGTWSNLETGAALGSGTFNTMRVNMRKRKNEKGMPMSIKLTKLIVCPDIEQVARQISGSDKIPDSANNGINPWKGVDVMVYDHLTSTTAFFGMGDLDREVWGTHFIVENGGNMRVMPLTGADTSTTIIWGRMLRMKVAAGGTILRNFHYNAGA